MGNKPTKESKIYSKFFKSIFVLVFAAQVLSFCTIIFLLPFPYNHEVSYEFTKIVSGAVILVTWTVQTFVSFLRIEGLIIINYSKKIQIIVISLICIQLLGSFFAFGVYVFYEIIPTKFNLAVLILRDVVISYISGVSILADIFVFYTICTFSPKEDPIHEIMRKYGIIEVFTIIISVCFSITSMLLESNNRQYLISLIGASMLTATTVYYFLFITVMQRKARLKALSQGN